jgi:hypothetical protein
VRTEPAEDVFAGFRILEAGREIYATLKPENIHREEGEPTARSTIIASNNGGKVPIVRLENSTKSVFVGESSDRSLPEGKFDVVFSVHFGAQNLELKGCMRVNDKHPYVYWDN